MPLIENDEPPEVDAFGVRFTMEERGRLIRCHALRTSIDSLYFRPASNDAELLARFEKNRELFESLANTLYQAGYRTPFVNMISAG